MIELNTLGVLPQLSKRGMSARDLFHEAVKHGLEKEQWHISHDPLELEWEEVKVKIDLAAN